MFTMCFMMLLAFESSAAQDESTFMITIVNQHRFPTLEARLRDLSETIKKICGIKTCPNTGEIIAFPELKKSNCLSIDVLRTAFLNDRCAVLETIEKSLKHYETTRKLIIHIEVLDEITPPDEYLAILKEERENSSRK